MRAVVDVNVLISGVLSAKGPSAEILRASRDGLFEPVISELLLTELNRTLRYPKLRKRIAPEKATAFAGWIRGHGTLAEDPEGPPTVGSRDPDDDYLLRRVRDHCVDGSFHAWLSCPLERERA